MGKKKFISLSFLAGTMVGIGNVVNVSVEDKVQGAFLFSLGLLTILHLGLNLYTGKIGLMSEKVVDYILMLVFNMLGVILVTLLMSYCDKNLKDQFCSIAGTKLETPVLTAFIKSIFCGILMYVAVAAYKKETVDMIFKCGITILCVMVFILSGFRHCIADAYCLLYLDSVLGFISYLAVIFGNTVGAIGFHVLYSKID